MRLILEDLGPTFVKLGQILSLKPGFLPADYALELTKLQTRANPLDFSIIEKCLEDEYNKNSAKSSNISTRMRSAPPLLRKCIKPF